MNFDDLEWEPPSEAEMKLIQARRERSDQISKLMSNYLLKGYKMLGSVCTKCDTILLQDRQGVNYCVACSELESDTTKDDPLISKSAAISMAKELELASAAAATPSAVSHPSAGATAATQSKPAATSVLPTAESQNSRTSFNSEVKMEMTQGDEPAAPFLSMSSIDVQSYTTTASARSNADSSAQQINVPNSVSNSKIKSASVRDSGISSGLDREEHCVNANASVDDCNLNVSSHDSVHVSRLIEKIQWASLELQATHSIEYSIHLCQLMKGAGEAIVALRNARV